MEVKALNYKWMEDIHLKAVIHEDNFKPRNNQTTNTTDVISNITRIL